MFLGVSIHYLFIIFRWGLLNVDIDHAEGICFKLPKADKKEEGVSFDRIFVDVN